MEKNISVIMLFHNNPDIDLCIEVISEQLHPEDELIIVNDHSDSDILNEKVAPYLGNNVRMIQVCNYRGNRSYNRNLGASKAKNCILLFVDGDMLLCENALDLLRQAYSTGEYDAFIGAEHGMKYTDLHMSLHMGEVNYRKLLRTKGGRAFLFQHPLLSDWRRSDLTSPRYSDYYWIYFYTSFCSTTLTAFQKIGGFDESFITWGAEDVDIGYRLSRYGKIGYLSGLEGLHIPHPRNIWKQETFDRDNIRYLLDKYRTWHIELLSAFDSSCDLYDQMNKIYCEICQWDLPQIPIRPEANSLWIDLPGTDRETMTARWYDSNAVPSNASLLGIALPFCDMRFQNAYLTDNIFAYPSVLTARILLESTRVSQRVFLCPSQETRRKIWEESAFQRLTTLHRVCAVSSDPVEYDLKETDDGLIEVLTPENRKRLADAFSRLPVFPSAKARQTWSVRFARTLTRAYTLVNFLDIDTETVKEKLQNALGIRIGPCYSFRHAEDEPITFSEALPIALCQSAAPLLYVVLDFGKVRKGAIWQRDISSDLVYDQSGMLFACKDLDL